VRETLVIRIPMDNNFLNGNTRAGTIGGAFLVILLRVDYREILHTALLAAIGAIVSYIVSIFLKYIIRKFLRK
jgi:hypothetical protein